MRFVIILFLLLISNINYAISSYNPDNDNYLRLYFGFKGKEVVLGSSLNVVDNSGIRLTTAAEFYVKRLYTNTSYSAVNFGTSISFGEIVNEISADDNYKVRYGYEYKFLQAKKKGSFLPKNSFFAELEHI